MKEVIKKLEKEVDKMEATVYEFDNREVEQPEEQQVEEMTHEVATSDNGFVKGIVIGASVGTVLAGAAGTAWYFERNQSKKLLEQLEKAVLIATAVATGSEEVVFNKKEIDVTNIVMNNPEEYILEIMNHLDEVKMSKKLRQRWTKVLKNISDQAIHWRNEAKLAQKMQAEVEKINIVEEQ